MLYMHKPAVNGKSYNNDPNTDGCQVLEPYDRQVEDGSTWPVAATSVYKLNAGGVRKTHYFNYVDHFFFFLLFMTLLFSDFAPPNTMLSTISVHCLLKAMAESCHLIRQKLTPLLGFRLVGWFAASLTSSPSACLFAGARDIFPVRALFSAPRHGVDGAGCLMTHGWFAQQVF